MSSRIVIADDAPFMRELLHHVLQGAGYEIVGAAADGVELVDMVARLKPDVAIIDLSMPNKSGLEAAQEIQQFDSEVRMIACSTIDQQGVIVKALEAGCVNFILKPFEAESLLQTVERASQGQFDQTERANFPLKVGGK